MHLMRDKPAGRFSPACLFHPDLIVAIGTASEVGRQVMANLDAGSFKGGVVAADTPEDIAALPSPPDLAVIGSPPRRICWQALAAKGTFVAIVLAARVACPTRRAAAVFACWVRNRSASRCPASV